MSPSIFQLENAALSTDGCPNTRRCWRAGLAARKRIRRVLAGRGGLLRDAELNYGFMKPNIRRCGAYHLRRRLEYLAAPTARKARRDEAVREGPRHPPCWSDSPARRWRSDTDFSKYMGRRRSIAALRGADPASDLARSHGEHRARASQAQRSSPSPLRGGQASPAAADADRALASIRARLRALHQGERPGAGDSPEEESRYSELLRRRRQLRHPLERASSTAERRPRRPRRPVNGQEA